MGVACRIIVLLASLALPALARADAIKVLTTGAIKPVILAIAPDFEAKTGHKVDLQADTAGALTKRVEGGEAFDVLVLTPGPLKDFAAKGRIVPGSLTGLAKVGVGVAVKAGAPKPSIATVEDFRAALLAARKVAYIDPAAGGSSGIYLSGLFERLGIAADIKAKAVLVPGGVVATRLVSGEADLALQQISEILPVEGVTLVGPLPESIQNYTEYDIAVGAASSHRDAAQRFVAAVAGPAAAATIRAKGMLPMH